MYAVGAMIMIFLILSAISFDLQGDLRYLDDITERRSECLKLATALTETSISTYYTHTNLTLRYPADVYSAGVIEVQGAAGRRVTTSTSCTFNAYIYNPSLQCFSLPTQKMVNIINEKGNLTVILGAGGVYTIPGACT